MKKLFNWIIGIPLICILLIATGTKKATAQDVSVSYQAFYDNLAPYGLWVYDPQYGNVFVPYEDAGFRPYTRGYWAMTEYGNTWISDDPWGWACYHYGRWTYNGYYGWIWIPGYEWAPAWVSWRYGHGYAGWAPLGPGIYAGDGYYCPDNWWVFIEPMYIYHPRWHDHWEGYGRNRGYIRRTTFMNNYSDGDGGVRYNYGPRAQEIERTTGQPVTIYRTTTERSVGATRVTGNTINMYKPRVDKNSVNVAKPVGIIQAPHAIQGKGEAQNNNNAAPGFRQDQPKPTPMAPAPQHNAQPTPMHQPAPAPQHNPQPEPMHQQAPVPQHNPQPEPMHQPAPMPQHNPQPEPMHQPAPMPQHNPQPQPMHQPQPMPQHNPQPEPMHQPAPMPQHNPQPQPMHQPQPAPQQHSVQQPQPMRANPQPQHSAPPRQAAPPVRKEEKK